jgi:creatinine amidohydrolase
MRREVRWERMFPDELEEAFAECPLLYYTYGLCEPHGPQNAIGLDALKAHAIACLAAQEHGGIVAPVDFWHIHELGGYALWSEKSIGQVPHSWLTCLPPWVHFKNVLYQIRQADAIGFQAVILFTGHYGPNWEDLNTLVSLVQPYVGARLYSLPDFEANTPGFASDGHSGGDHAGRVETSLLWALDADSVDISRVPADVNSHPYAMGADVLQSSRRIGERMVDDEVRYLGTKASELLAAYRTQPPTQCLRTFAQTENLWQEVVWPALKGFKTMQSSWNWGDEAFAPDSIWRANWQVPDLEAGPWR